MSFGLLTEESSNVYALAVGDDKDSMIDMQGYIFPMKMHIKQELDNF